MQHIDELKNKWQNINFGSTAETASQPTPMKLPRSASQRLDHTFNAIIVIGIMGLCLSGTFFNVFGPPTWFKIYFCLFFVMALAENFMLKFWLRKLDLATLTTIEAIRGIERFNILRNRLKILNICVAIPLLSAMFYYIFNDNSDFSPASRYGSIAGGIIGATIGFWLDRRCRRDIRMMRRYLGTDTPGNDL